MIPGIWHNTLNPQLTWRDESSTLAAFVLTSLSVLYRL